MIVVILLKQLKIQKSEKEKAPKKLNGESIIIHRKQRELNLTIFFLSLIVAGAFLLRVIPNWQQVFTSTGILFNEVDPWYQMRLVDYLIANFPHRLTFDSMALYPGGAPVGFYPLMTYLIALLGKLFNYEIIGALLPPIMGALTVIPVFLLGQELFNRNTGLLAGLLIGIMPSELLHRSLLGFTDQHVMEAFLMVWTILFLLKALKKRGVWILLAGGALALYMFNWHGGPFFLFILMVWFFVEFLYSFSKGRPLFGKTLWVYMGTSLVAGGLLLPLLPGIALLVLLPLIPFGVLYLASRYLPRADFYFFLISASAFLLSLLLFNRLSLGGWIINSFKAIYISWGTTVGEAQPSSLLNLIISFGMLLPLAPLGFYFHWKKRGNWLFIVWAMLLIVATLSQRRWAYYSIIPMSLLGSYAIFHLASFIKAQVKTSLLALFIPYIILVSSFGSLKAASTFDGPTQEWREALAFLQKNTPSPFSSPNYYLEENPGKALYGIIAWWDYGHWIIRGAKRIPVSSPAFQDQPLGYQVFASSSWDEALKYLKGVNIRYIIVDKALLGPKWYAALKKAGKKLPVTGSVAFLLWSEINTGPYQLVFSNSEIKIFERKEGD